MVDIGQLIIQYSTNIQHDTMIIDWPNETRARPNHAENMACGDSWARAQEQFRWPNEEAPRDSVAFFLWNVEKCRWVSDTNSNYG